MAKKCVNPNCPRPGGLFTAKRSDAKTCSDACRAVVSRSNRGAGSPERRERQREGLDKRYVYPRIVDDLQKGGLVPTAAGPTDPDGNLTEGSPQFDNTRKYEWRKKHKDSATWHPADGWWKDEPITTCSPMQEELYRRLRYGLVYGDKEKALEAMRSGGRAQVVHEPGRWERGPLIEIDGLAMASSVNWVPGEPRMVVTQRVSVTQRIEGEEMIASDERIALDAERLGLLARRFAADAEALAAIAGRLRERFPLRFRLPSTSFSGRYKPTADAARKNLPPGVAEIKDSHTVLKGDTLASGLRARSLQTGSTERVRGREVSICLWDVMNRVLSVRPHKHMLSLRTEGLCSSASHPSYQGKRTLTIRVCKVSSLR